MTSSERKAKGFLTVLILGLTVIALISLRPALTKYRSLTQNFAITPANLLDEHSRKLVYYSGGTVGVARWLRRQAAPTDGIFSFRPNDLFFLLPGKTVLSQTDARLIDLYHAADAEDLRQRLLAEGIIYIHTPGYSVPGIFASSFNELLADPALTKLVAAERNHRVYQVHARPANVRMHSVFVDPSPTPSMDSENWTIYDPQVGFQPPSQFLDFLTDTNEPTVQRWVYTGRGYLNRPPSEGFRSINLQPNQTYSLSASGAGTGLLRAYLVEYDKEGTLLTRQLVWEGLLDQSPNRISGQLITSSLSVEGRLLFELHKGTELDLGKVELVTTGVGPEQRAPFTWRSSVASRDEYASSKLTDWFIDTATNELAIDNPSSLRLQVESRVIPLEAPPVSLSFDLSGTGEIEFSIQYCSDQAEIIKQDVRVMAERQVRNVTVPLTNRRSHIAVPYPYAVANTGVYCTPFISLAATLSADRNLAPIGHHTDRLSLSDLSVETDTTESTKIESLSIDPSVAEPW